MSKIMYHETIGTLGDINEKLAGNDASEYLKRLQAFNNGQNAYPGHFVSIPGQAIWEKIGDDLIYITLPPSEGVTGPKWIEDLKDRDFYLTEDAKIILRSQDFQPTTPRFVHRIVVLRANFWKKKSDRNIACIQSEGVSRKWAELHSEAPCIIRNCFSDRELEKMGLVRIIGIRNKPFEGCHGGPRFLCVSSGAAGRRLRADLAYPESKMDALSGLAWSLPEEISSP
ncbi:MAG TPA: hypothetical protein VK675_03380 [Candidatus Paceibacterota bacterium]|nr:hypothetical protein [Candidatus Paceibacterota bacterium]